MKYQFSLMRKKLVKQGHSTLTLTIPAKWIKENKLKAGSEIELEEINNSIIISATTIPKEESISLDITNLHKTGINWLLAATYKKGYDEIIIKYENNSQLKTINDRIKDCLKNYEIIEQNNSRVTIKSISNSQDENFEVLLRRIFRVNASFFKSILESLKQNKYSQLLDAIYLEETNDSLVNTCQRIIIKNKKLSKQEACFDYVIIWQLEKIADTLKHFCQEVNERKKITNKLVAKFEEVSQLYESFYQIFYDFDSKKLDFIIQNKRNLLSQFEDKEEFYLRLLSEQIFDLSGSYFALKIS